MRLLLLAAAAAALAYSVLLPKPLDGSVWEVKVRRDALLTWSRRDTLVFEGGRVAVAGPVASGVAPARYSTHGAGDGLQWTATLTSEEGETLSWQGAVAGERVEGTVLSTDASGRVTRLKFAGLRKKQK
ncbi:MAG: hypothetical protein HY553_16255 [Elusimicrobia bacterium]|nr:hypothetical protein [Elusimicrobiota bacterium]